MAPIKGITPLQALDGMMLKHYVSYQDIVEGITNPTINVIDQKIGDLICYLILAEALLIEKKSIL